MNSNFYLEKPSIIRKEEAINYVNEFIKEKKELKGLGKIKEILYDLKYEDYLKYLEDMESDKIGEVPETTYFLIRKKDNKIVGITNLRHYLNDRLEKCGGHIGYGIRPNERNKGYGKIALYLTLIEARKMNIKEVRVDCEKDNEESNRLVLKVGGTLYKSIVMNDKIINEYIFNTDKV